MLTNLDLDLSPNSMITLSNAKAYTEDNIVIYNILFECPLEVAEHDIRKYFGNFGSINEMGFLADYTSESLKRGFVHFANATDAAMILEIPEHVINMKPIRVCADDSWQQPDAKNNVRNNNGTNEYTKEMSTSILNLNYDCFEIIFEYLSLKDQVSVARTCGRLRSLFEMYAKREYKYFELYDFTEDELTLWEVRDFLEIVGPHMVMVAISGKENKCHDRFLEYVSLYCTNLSEICLVAHRLKRSVLDRVFTNLSYLLLSLDLTYGDLCQHIKDFKTVECLNLTSCDRMQNDNLLEICKNLTELHTLAILKCKNLESTIDIAKMITYLNNLRKLEISCLYSKQVDLLATLPKLEDFSYKTSDDIDISFFNELVRHKSDQLVSLRLQARRFLSLGSAQQISELKKLKWLGCHSSVDLTDEAVKKLALLPELEELKIFCYKFTIEKGLLEVIRYCQTLNTLDLCGCREIEASFVSDVLKLLRDERVQRQRKKPLIICAIGCVIDESELDFSELDLAGELLHVKFDLDTLKGCQSYCSYF
ncbi:uncharacterized protein LOC133333533 [Musca vetustissima]|uniref:uncharacterized protein LOC133333533 n=1 Tax=Musca vetustissima TaxID=27455 RepID=UPI002AB6F1FB|nr:uncharacterized protein LOC133333533 [Musca vetustissima]